MARGHQHDQAVWALALPTGLLAWPWLGWGGATTVAVAFLIGGLMLSPDLDTRSRPTARWGALALLWWPYRRLLRHRSLVSHSPLLGTAGRLAYLSALGLGLALLLAPLGAPTPQALVAAGATLWRRHPGLVLAALAGLEASSWLHLIQDGDPIPKTPRLLRPLLRQRRRQGGGGRRRRRPHRPWRG